MTHSTKCRAKGGATLCTDPKCPEKQAIISDFMAAQARRDQRQNGNLATITRLPAHPQPGQEITITLKDDWHGHTSYTDYIGIVKRTHNGKLVIHDIDITHRNAAGHAYKHEDRPAQVMMAFDLQTVDSWEITDPDNNPTY